MDKSQAKNLFLTQTELIDMKVDMAVNKAIDRVVEQISSLKHEMHREIDSLRGEMYKCFSSLEHRIIAVETKLGMVNETRQAVRARLIDYGFKAGWLTLGTLLSTLFFLAYTLIK